MNDLGPGPLNALEAPVRLRPMSEAPRDGTAFLGFSAKYGWWGTCRFDHPDDELPEVGDSQWVFMQPVHLAGWLPLPSLPVDVVLAEARRQVEAGDD